MACTRCNGQEKVQRHVRRGQEAPHLGDASISRQSWKQKWWWRYTRAFDIIEIPANPILAWSDQFSLIFRLDSKIPKQKKAIGVRHPIDVYKSSTANVSTWKTRASMPLNPSTNWACTWCNGQEKYRDMCEEDKKRHTLEMQAFQEKAGNENDDEGTRGRSLSSKFLQILSWLGRTNSLASSD